MYFIDVIGQGGNIYEYALVNRDFQHSGRTHDNEPARLVFTSCSGKTYTGIIQGFVASTNRPDMNEQVDSFEIPFKLTLP